MNKNQKASRQLVERMFEQSASKFGISESTPAMKLFSIISSTYADGLRISAPDFHSAVNLTAKALTIANLHKIFSLSLDVIASDLAENKISALLAFSLVLEARRTLLASLSEV